MSIVTLSPKYQIVIPKDVRQEFNIKPGTKFNVFQYNGKLIEIVPVIPIGKLAGSLPGLSSEGIRDKFDRAL